MMYEISYDLAKRLALSGGVELRDPTSTVIDPLSAERWRTYLANADKMLVAMQVAFPEITASIEAHETRVAELQAEALTLARSEGEAEGYARGIEEAAKVADAWLSTGTMKLRAGELTAGEVRAVKAIVGSIAVAIRALEKAP